MWSFFILKHSNRCHGSPEKLRTGADGNKSTFLYNNYYKHFNIVTLLNVLFSFLSWSYSAALKLINDTAAFLS